MIFFLKIRRPPISTRTDALFPYTTLVRSVAEIGEVAIVHLRHGMTGGADLLVDLQPALHRGAIVGPEYAVEGPVDLGRLGRGLRGMRGDRQAKDGRGERGDEQFPDRKSVV